MNTFQDSVLTAFSLITSLDPVLAGIVLRSLAVSACACVLACSLGLVLGAWLGVARFAGRGVVLAFLNTALALPSVVVGLVVYLAHYWVDAQGGAEVTKPSSPDF
jgi:tungstate transport system permease protein